MFHSTTFLRTSLSFWLLILGSLLIIACQGPPNSPPTPSPTPIPTPNPDPTEPEATQLGVNNLNGAVECHAQAPYILSRCYNNQQAAELGITWNRWPVQ